jgi:hypothetical protein
MAQQTPVKVGNSPVIDLTFSPVVDSETERVQLYQKIEVQEQKIKQCKRIIKDSRDRISEIENTLLNESLQTSSAASKLESNQSDDSSEGTIFTEPIIFGRKRKFSS